MSSPRRYDWTRGLGAVSLAALLALGSALVLARGRGAGGAADLEFGIIDPADVTLGLPGNLVAGWEPVSGLTATLTGFGGVPQGGNGATVINQSGNQISLLIGGTLSGGTRVVGVSRSLGPDGLPPLVSLKMVAIPPTPELERFIRDNSAAVALGKALFWDLQVGSDGNACASCHFSAGADNRTKNQISPGFLGGDHSFQPMPSGPGGPNYQLRASDFPTYRLQDPLDRESAVLFQTNDVVGSQGTLGSAFLGLSTTLNAVAGATELCGAPPRDEFAVGGVHTRRVEPRNTPTVINAVFNYRNFWDGRANNVFNGVNPFGPRDTGARVLVAPVANGPAVPTSILLHNASLASQAVGPALSEFEMSCAHKAFRDLGRKMLASRPLALQMVASDDSVLARYRSRLGSGLSLGYADLIRGAFDPQWWSGSGLYDGYTQMEANFSLFWGLAIMAYEATLVSDEAPIDRFIGWPGSPANPLALDAQQQRGLALFRGRGMCISCHKGAEYTGAATGLQPTNQNEGSLIESMFLTDGSVAIYDDGFYNIGVRPTSEDIGVGGSDPFGGPLSYSRNWFSDLQHQPDSDPQWIDPCRFSVFFDPAACWNAPDPLNTRVAVDGAFKTPSLRNIALTRPYFHNGSRLTLEQVIEFYNRGGDRRGPVGNDSSAFSGPTAPNGGGTNVHPDVHPLGLLAADIDDLAAFLRHALTDPRVACERAPFDHPSLRLTNGHVGNEKAVVDRNADGSADDAFIILPAVGAAGRAAALCLPNDDGSAVRLLP